MNNYPLSSKEYTQTHTHLTLHLPISTFCKIFLLYSLDGLGVLKHKDCDPACTVQEQLQGFIVSDVQYAMIPSISSPIRSSTTGAAISTAKVSSEVSCEQQMKCIRFQVGCCLPLEALPTSWPIHQICSISLTGYHWYHLSTVSKVHNHRKTTSHVF